MVTTTPEKIVSFDAGVPQESSAFEQLRGKSRTYFDNTVTAAQEHPWAAAAIGAGVVATVAATAYGATKFARRSHTAEEEGSMIDPEAVPEALPIE